MKIAVTGATGFLGAALVRELARQGHAVTALVRRPEQASQLAGAQVERFDAGSGPAPGVLAGNEAVIHLAGESISQRWTAASKARILESRTKGTAAVVEAARQARTVKVLLSASAVGYYGARGSRELVENSPPGDDFLARVCVAWEKASAPAREAGIRTVNLRTGIVLHPDGGALRAMLMPFRMGIGGRIGSGTQYMSWIHREDWLDLCVHCLETESLQGPVNLTAPAPVTNREFTSALGRALHRPALLPAPGFALKLAFGEMADMLLEGQRVLPARAIATGFQFHYTSLEWALRDLLARTAA